MSAQVPKKQRLTPRKRPTQERSQATVAAILDAAARVFQREGYAGGTTNRIAEVAGVSIGSLYEYFPGKDALLAALAERHMEEGLALVWSLLGEALVTPLSLEDTVGRVLEAMIALHQREPRLHRVLFEEVPLPGVLRRQIDEAEAALVALVTQLIVARPDVKVSEPQLASYLVVRVAESLTHGFVLHPPPGQSTEAFVREGVLLIAGYLRGPARAT